LKPFSGRRRRREGKGGGRGRRGRKRKEPFLVLGLAPPLMGMWLV